MKLSESEIVEQSLCQDLLEAAKPSLDVEE